MKRALSLVLALAMITAYQLPPLLAAAQNTGEISGIAVIEGKPLSNIGVRLRNVDSSQVVGTTTTDAQGAFRFTGVPTGNYVVEVDTAGRLLGTSTRISLSAGSMVANGVTVTTTAAAGAAAGGGGFFTSTAGIITLAAIGAGLTIGIVAATGSASPSR